jgi:hypothetical protein
MAIVGIMRNDLSVPLPTIKALARDLLNQIDATRMIGVSANATITIRGPMTVGAITVIVHKRYRIIEIEDATLDLSAGLSATTATIATTVSARDRTHHVEVVVHMHATTGNAGHVVSPRIAPIKSSLKETTNGSPIIMSQGHTMPVHSRGRTKETRMTANRSHNAM